MRAEEIEHRCQHGALAQPLAQGHGREPGQRQQPPGAILVGEQPAERTESKRFGIGGGGWRVAQNCQCLSEVIVP